MTESERRRLQDAFRRLSNHSAAMGKSTFVSEVLGAGFPTGLAGRTARQQKCPKRVSMFCQLRKYLTFYEVGLIRPMVSRVCDHMATLLAERIFGLVSAGDGGGGVGAVVNSGGSGGRQGVHFKEMLALLVLITKGTEEEKHKCESF